LVALKTPGRSSTSVPDQSKMMFRIMHADHTRDRCAK
jgi:hypothetical protein